MLKISKKQLKSLIGEDVSIIYNEPHKNNVVIFARIVEADETGIAVQMDAGPKVILMANLNGITSKSMRFVNPKQFFYSTKEERDELNIQMDKINTQIIEKIKNLPKYYLSTRNARFTKNGDFVKKKITQNEFEAEVFGWFKQRKSPLELCPLALLNNELLLTLYQKRFLLLKRNFAIVFDTQHHDINDILRFIFDKNTQINDKRNSSLRAIAQDWL